MGLRPTNSDENERVFAIVWRETWSGRGRDRSGEVEAVREFDPDRAL